MVFDHLGHGITQALHRLLGHGRLGWFLHGSNCRRNLAQSASPRERGTEGWPCSDHSAGGNLRFDPFQIQLARADIALKLLVNADTGRRTPDRRWD
jgi:hypothetical protein